jgi:molybdenum cofactor biosynthesis enzyme MoaA
MRNLLERWPKVLSERQPNQPDPPQYNPVDFVVPAGEIDLQRRRLYRPLTVLFRVSDDCMRNCIYCNVQRRKTRDLVPLTLDRYRSLASEARSIGVQSVQIGGGDPFVRKDIVEIISAFTSDGLTPIVSTKSRISRDIASRLHDAGVRRMQVSLDAPSPALADRMTQSSGSFEQITSSIRNLLRRGHTRPDEFGVDEVQREVGSATG